MTVQKGSRISCHVFYVFGVCVWGEQMEVSYAAAKGGVFCKWKHKSTLLVFCLPSQGVSFFPYTMLLAVYGISNSETRMGGVSDTNVLLTLYRRVDEKTSPGSR